MQVIENDELGILVQMLYLLLYLPVGMHPKCLRQGFSSLEHPQSYAKPLSLHQLSIQFRDLRMQKPPLTVHPI